MVDPLGTKAVSTNDRQVAAVVRAAAPAPAQPATNQPATNQSGSVLQSSVAGVAKDAAQNAPVDLERVARIRKAIADGNFPIYPATVADRLIAMKLEWTPGT